MLRVFVTIALLLAPPAAAAEAVVVCHVGGPGSTRQAQPSLDRFLRHLEHVAGLEANTLRGEYHTRADRCAEYVDRAEPALGVFDLATWLARRGDWGLDPIAHFGAPKAERYHLLVRDAAFHNLDSLRGASLTSVYVGDNDFTSRIVFGNRLEVDAHFRAERARRPLRAVRAVIRGKKDAALVDHYTFEHIGEIDTGGTLRALFSSEGLPGLTLGQMDGRADDLARRVAKALPRLCANDGAALCKALQVKALVAANGRLMSRLQKRYDAGRQHLGDRAGPNRGSQPLGPGRNTTGRHVNNKGK